MIIITYVKEHQLLVVRLASLIVQQLVAIGFPFVNQVVALILLVMGKAREIFVGMVIGLITMTVVQSKEKKRSVLLIVAVLVLENMKRDLKMKVAGVVLHGKLVPILLVVMSEPISINVLQEVVRVLMKKVQIVLPVPSVMAMPVAVG